MTSSDEIRELLQKLDELSTVLSVTIPDRKALRDEFAMSALNGILSCETVNSLEIATDNAYKIADLMMKARQPKSTDTKWEHNPE